MPSPVEWFALGLGLIGTTLGIVNGIQQILSARIRLTIKSYPLHVIQTDTESETFACVEIANTGSFPVTIKEVCFELKSYPGARSINSKKRCIDGKRLPRRVEAHDAIQVCFPDIEFMMKHLNQSKRIVVETACGQTRFGSLKFWHNMIAKEEKAAPESNGEETVI